MRKMISMKQLTAALLIAALAITMLTSTACARAGSDSGLSGKSKDQAERKSIESASSKKTTTVTVKIRRKTFKAEIYKNKTTKKLLKKFPLKLTMEELNGNEKYKYLSFSLPTKEKKVKKIKAGDIMLYGDDCLVIFYKSFKTSYRYTKIGHITNTKGLKKAVGKGSVKVRFKK